MRVPVIAPEFPPVLRRVAIIMALMLGASVVFTVFMTRRLEFPIPFGLVWMKAGSTFCDFKVFHERSLHFRTAAYWFDYEYPMTYPAVVAVIFALLYKLPHPLQIYLLILGGGCLTWVVWLSSGLTQRRIPLGQAVAFSLVMLATTWPVYYEFDTANIEGLMAIILFVGILLVLRKGSGFQSYAGAGLIAMAGAMKLYPAIMFGILLSKRRYKECAFGVVLMGILNYGSLALLGPSIGVAQGHIRDGVRFFRDVFVTPQGSIYLNFNHALYMPLKYVVLIIDRVVHNGGRVGDPLHELLLMDALLTVYVVIMAVVGFILYFRWIRKLPMLNQVIALTVASVLFTPFSSDYTLVHLLLPLGLICFYAVEKWHAGEKVAGLETCFASIAITIGCSTFFTIYYGFENIFRCAALCVLLVTTLRLPFYWERLDDVDRIRTRFAFASEGA